MASALASYSDAVTEPRKVHTVTTSMRMLPQSRGSLKAAGLAGDKRLMSMAEKAEKSAKPRRLDAMKRTSSFKLSSSNRKLRRGAASSSNVVGASRDLSESRKNRLAGMSCSPAAISSRHDVQCAFQMLFNDKSSAELEEDRRFKALSLRDVEESTDAMDMLKRKIRSTVAPGTKGAEEWDTLFEQYDRDGNGELNCQEFIKAVRKENGITKKVMDDKTLAKLFKKIDTDGGGTICSQELQDFIAWKPKKQTTKVRPTQPEPMLLDAC